jgi:hypothetical protein
VRDEVQNAQPKKERSEPDNESPTEPLTNSHSWSGAALTATQKIAYFCRLTDFESATQQQTIQFDC